MNPSHKLLLLAALLITIAGGFVPVQAAQSGQPGAPAAATTLLQRELAKIGYPQTATRQFATDSAGGRISALSPNDPYYLGGIRWALDLPNFPDAWSLTTGDAKTVIAIVDTGVDPNANDLQGALLPGYDFVNNDANSADDNGHGTMMASLAAARINNGIGIAGGCGSCSILPVKVAGADGHALWSTLAAGIVWAADQGARVISVSIAGKASSSQLESAVAYAQSKGAVVVAAAGNDALVGPEYPAALPGVVSVEATDPNGNPYPFSNHGSTVTLAAPGCATAEALDNSYRAACGSSTSTPLVASAAALLASYQPTLTGPQIVSALEQGADRSGDSQFGRLNAYQALLGSVVAPASTSLPTIGGSAILGGQLTASAGAWSGSSPTSLSYQWLRCLRGHCVNIQGATSSSYTVTAADQGRTLKITLTAVNGVGQATATSVGVSVKAATKTVQKPKLKLKHRR